jgi:hypothetical protein
LDAARGFEGRSLSVHGALAAKDVVAGASDHDREPASATMQLQAFRRMEAASFVVKLPAVRSIHVLERRFFTLV